MRDLLFVSERLDDINKELGVSSFAGFLEEAKRKVQKILSTDKFYIDIILHPIAAQKVQQLAADFKEASILQDHYSINIKKENISAIKIFEQIFTGVAFVFFDDVLNNDEKLKNEIKSISDQYKLIIFFNFFEDETLCKQFTRQLNYNTKSAVVSAADCNDKSVDDILKSIIPEADRLQKLKRFSYFNSIKPIFNFLNDIFISENKTIQTRKQLNSQNTLITRREEQGVNVSDLSSNIRQLMQKMVQELDKNFKIKYEDLNKPNTGKFSITAQQKSMHLEEFTKSELAEKSEKVGIAIKKDFIDDFVTGISSTIKTELVKDEVFIKSSMVELLTNVNKQLKTKAITLVKAEDIFIPFPEQQRVMNSFCYMSKVFNGELTKKGATEYFIALRDYIGVMMVATGLLAPLNLIASLSDEHSMFGFLKKLSVGIKVATALLTITLIVYGIFDLRRRIPLKRIEENERELTKAREILFQEAKRMFNESSRDWYGNISIWVKETTQNISNQIEKNMKDIQLGKINQLNQEKIQQQKMQQSIEMIQRNILTAEKVKDQLAQRFRDMITETEKDLKL